MPDRKDNLPSPTSEESTISSNKSPNVSFQTVNDKLDQVNGHLIRLENHSKELISETRDNRKNANREKRISRAFLQKMAIEVPPVVLAVLLAFGINSWWQQRKANQVAVQSLSNIISESKANLMLYERLIELDERNLKRLNQQIQDVKAGVVYPDTLYGQAVNLFTLREGAWQAATVAGAVENYDQRVLQDASEMYSKIHFRNISHAEFNKLNGYERYQEETLIPFLLENREVLEDHIQGCLYEMDIVHEFLTKYSHFE